MAYRKYKKKQIYRKKRNFRKRGMKNPVGKGIGNGTRLFRSKIQGYVTLFAPANTTQYEYRNSFPLNFPGNYVNNSGNYITLTNGAIGAIQVTSIANIKASMINMFDMYKVQSFELHWIPAGIWTQSVSAVAEQNKVGFSSNLIYQKDYDDVAAFVDNETAMNQGIRPLSLVRPLRIRMPQLKSRANVWYNCQSMNLAPTSAPTQNDVVPPLSYGGLKIYCQDIPVTNSVDVNFLGRFYLTWDVIFKGVNGLTQG